ncbi:hypothetical protein [Neorhodopirellula pilleata]|uniref:Leucine Rich repeats (2 copies) n=1 Tax=Neorhodopirellula pilleata TaxID=2714738 RepID=A0A5C6A6D0_9BACT|nr:hypothetical protein [Neorhodopirellula pilleata]TWT94950.1 hypothetical protein Pla100_35290 [Neorhodopirellula pilleata]
MALEVELIDGRRTAYIREESDIFEIQTIQGIESLWVMSECRGWLREPLRLPELKVLYVSSSTLPIIQLIDSGCIARLEWILIAASPGSLTGLSSIDILKSLSRLKVRQQRLEQDEVTWIHRQTDIKFLSLTDLPIDDTVLAALNCKSSLRRLDVYGTNVRFESNAIEACRFEYVRSLDISNTHVGSSGASRICTAFPNIERLIATGTRLTSSDVSEIRRLPKLRVLETGYKELDFDNVNDAFWDL